MGKGGKDTYKIKNWSEYNKSLCNRGRLTLFIPAGVIDVWGKIDPKKKVVGEKMYPDSIIECCQLIKNQFHLRLRQAQGFIESIFSLMPRLENISVPDFSTSMPQTGWAACGSEQTFRQWREPSYRDRFNRVKSIWRRGMERPQTWLVKTPDMDENEHMYGFGYPGNTCGRINGK